MKKFICLLIFIFFMVGCIFFGTSLFSKDNNSYKKQKVSFIEEKLQVNKEPTYKFVGFSEHFSFATGEAYYDNSYKELLLTNFKLIKEIKNIQSYNMSISFNNRLLLTNEMLSQNEKDIKDFLNDINLSVAGEDNQYERDAFMQTEKETFKTSIKISFGYCLNNKEYYEEELTINYID